MLGASAAITPIAVEKGIIKKDYPLSIFVSILLRILSLDIFLFHAPAMTLGRIDGIILLIVFIFFMYTTLKDGFKHRSKLEETEDNQNISLLKSILICMIGLAGIIIGGDLSVDGAKEIARAFGLSEALIGLTIVAFGTSLPELVTSIIAAKKGESDIAVGNVIGSNIFNILLILGLSATILPMNVSSTYLYDIGILIIIMIATFIPIAKRKIVGRGMGITMVITYILYTAYLILR